MRPPPPRVPGFSRRLPASLAPAAWGRELASRRPALDLTATLPSDIALLPPEVSAALCGPAAAAYRPEPLGECAARAFLAAELRAMGSATSAARTMLVASTSEAYATLIKLVCNPGEAVAVAEPGYPLVAHIAALEGVGARPYHLVERQPTGAPGWRCDLVSLERALAGGARLVAWVAPHNPTGHLSDVGEARAVAALCRRHRAVLVVDEVFRPLCGADWAPLEAAWSAAWMTFFIGGLSKWAGMAHLKLGWIRLAGGGPHHADAMERLAWLGDTYLSVNQPVQAALPALWVAGVAWRQALGTRLAVNRSWLADALAARPALRERAVGGWMSIVRALGVEAHDAGLAGDAAWAAHLADHDVRVQPGFLYDLPEAAGAGGAPPAATWVTSLVVPPALFAAGWRRILSCEQARAAARPAGRAVPYEPQAVGALAEVGRGAVERAAVAVAPPAVAAPTLAGAAPTLAVGPAPDGALSLQQAAPEG